MKKTYAQILDAAVSQPVPDTVNIAPRILAHIPEGARIRRERKEPVHLRLKFAATLMLVLMALLALTTAAYAVYRWIGDPGLQSVQDAGLLTGVDATALPTLLPTQTSPAAPQPASSPALSQSRAGVTVTLDWAYLDEGRLALGFNFSELPAGAALGAPRVTFRDITPAQAQGFSQSIRTQDGQAVYVSYQVIHAAEVGGKVSLDLDLPLVQVSGETQNELATFHFAVEDLPVYAGQRLAVDQTYAVRRSGVEVRLKSVRVMPSTTEVVACYDFPAGDAPFWYMQHATVQIGDGPEEGYRPYQYLREIKDDHCVKLGFAVGNAGGTNAGGTNAGGVNAGGEDHLTFRVHRLVVPLTMQDVVSPERIAAANQALEQAGIEIRSAPADQSEGPGGWQFVREPEWGMDPAKDPRLLVLQALEESETGPWEFHVDIPAAEIVPGQAAPTPTPAPVALGEQTLEGVTLTLDWAYADVKRVAVGYTISGLPDVRDTVFLNGQIVIKDSQGNILAGGGGGHSSIQYVDGKPGTVTGSWSALLAEPLAAGEETLKIDITLDGSSPGFDWNRTLAVFAVPPEATPLPPGETPPTLPDRLIGTYHFEVQTDVFPLQAAELGQTVEAGGIAMRLVRAEMTPSYARFTLCYPKPSANDWMIGGSPSAVPTLQAGGYTAPLNGYTLLADADYGGYLGKSPDPIELPELAAGERCVQIDFLLGHSDPARSLTLTIPALEQSPPEVVPDAEMKAAREILLAEGIEMDYTTSSSAGGGGGGGPVFSKLPEGMDQQEAYRRYMNALGYVHPGPWVFRIDVRP